MTLPADDRASTLFLALSQVPPGDRAAAVAAQCGGDDVLKQRVERLLASLDLPDTAIPQPAIDPSAPSGAVVGGFVVLRQIGAGSAGVVHLARQAHPARIVALKILRREFIASEIQRRFEIEAEVLAQLHHPGIAQIFAAHPGDATTPPFIAMEFVDGPPVTEFADVRRLDVRARVELVAQICDAVQHAHQRGVIHRDIKPGNILVGVDGQPKVLDFGVARRTTQQSLTAATESGQLVGTLAYMSPEQVRAVPGEIDTRTDIHALGVVLFRLLAGKLPFAHDDPSLPELARRIQNDEAPRLSTFTPALKGDLDIIVARALAREKERRYSSAASLASDLRRYLAGHPIAATADSAWYIVRRQVGRYRLALGLSAGAFVAVSALASYALVQRDRADRTNVEMQHQNVEMQRQLASNTIERGRLLALTGNQPVAEDLVWRELFKNPDSEHARWALWEMYARAPSLWMRTIHQTGTQSVRFSADRTRIVSVGRLDRTLMVLDAETGRQIRSITWKSVADALGTPRRLHVTARNKIVLATDDGTIRRWDLESGVLEKEMVGVVPRLLDLALGPDEDTALLVSSGRVELWSMAQPARLAEIRGIGSRPVSAVIHPNGRFGAVLAEEGNVTGIDIARRRAIWQRKQHVSTGISVAVDPAGRVVASGDASGAIRLTDARTGALIRAITTSNGRIRALVFDEAGNQLVAGGVWRTEIWDLTDATRPPRVLGSSEGVTDVAIYSDLTRVATCNGGDNGWVRMWSPSADTRVSSWSAHTGMVTGIAATGDGSLISVGVDAVLARWRIGASAPLSQFQGTRTITGVGFSSDRRWIVTSGSGRIGVVWDAATGEHLAELTNPRGSRGAVFALNDRRIAIGEFDGAVRLWDWDGHGVSNPLVIPATRTEVMALATAGEHLFVAQNDRAVVMRDVRTGQEIKRFRTSSVPYSAAVSPDGRSIALGTFLGAVDVFDIETGALRASLKGQTALVFTLDFTGDGRILAVGSRDGSTRLWDFTSSQLLATIASRMPGVSRVRFLSDGHQLAIGYDDGLLEIRDLQYFFRYAAGNAEFQLRKFNAAGEQFPRSAAVLEWARGLTGVK